MNIKELKDMAVWGIRKWIDTRLPKDGDYRNPPEIVSDERGGGDYAVTFIFHNNLEASESNGSNIIYRPRE